MRTILIIRNLSPFISKCKSFSMKVILSWNHGVMTEIVPAWGVLFSFRWFSAEIFMR